MLEAQRTERIAPLSAFKVPGLRWWIIGLVFLATLINYIDRLTISVLAPVITKDLGLSNTQFGGIVVWFLLAYTISQSVSGKVYDRVGTRLGFTFSIIIWSAAAMAHAFARGLASLSTFRFLLGFGEAGNWPGAAKTVAEWFPIRQRALGMAIFNSGAAIGSIAAPPLIVWLQLSFGWQTTFVVTGSLGFLWLGLWLLFYESPERHPWLSSEEYRLIREEADGETGGHGDPETRRHGDGERGGRGDGETTWSGELEAYVPPSPNLPVSFSADLPVPPSPRLPVFPSPRLRV